MRRETAIAGALVAAFAGALLLVTWPATLGLVGFGPAFDDAQWVCFEPGPLVLDVRQAPPDLASGEPFGVPDGCRLQFQLDVRNLAGDLRVWVTGPGGFPAYAAHLQGVDAGNGAPPAVERDEQAAPGLVPAGRYDYHYEVAGTAGFTFSVAAHRAV